MNKTQLAQALSGKLGVAVRPDCVNFIDALAATIFECLSRGEPVYIQGLGRFEIRIRKIQPHLRNFRTGQPIKTGHSRAVRFVPSSAWRELLNGRKPRTPKAEAKLLRKMMEG